MSENKPKTSRRKHAAQQKGVDALSWLDAQGTEQAHAARDEIERLRRDAARLDLLMRNLSAHELRRFGIAQSTGCTREDIDRWAQSKPSDEPQQLHSDDPAHQDYQVALGFLAGLHPGLTVDHDRPMACAEAIFDSVIAEREELARGLASAGASVQQMNRLYREAIQGREDLAAMIRSLAHGLKKRLPPDQTGPDSLPARAVDLLRRMGLLGSPLRDGEIKPAVRP